MISVQVTGGKKKEREVVTEVAYWCVKKLMPKMKSINIDISIEKNIDIWGDCLMSDSNRDFELRIQKGLSIFDLITTVCHEMVHVKQYARREMDDYYRWKSRKISEKVDYEKQPWEKEAFKLEVPLALECVKQLQVSL